jgi:hypothetical protein
MALNIPRHNGIRLFQSCVLVVFSPSPEIVDKCTELCQCLIDNPCKIRRFNDELRVSIPNENYYPELHDIELWQIALKLNCPWKIQVEKTYVPID